MVKWWVKSTATRHVVRERERDDDILSGRSTAVYRHMQPGDQMMMALHCALGVQ